MISSRRQQLKGIYDFLTLGKFKFFLFFLWFFTWLITKIIYVTGVGSNYLYPTALNYYPSDIGYWNTSGLLPNTPQRLIFWQNYLWNNSDLFDAIGIPLVIALWLILAVAFLRGE